MKIAITLILAAVVLAWAAKFWGAALQRHLTYYPKRAAESELLALAASSRFEPWRAGSELIGWKRPGTGGGPSALVFHGNSGYALHRDDLAATLESARPDLDVYVLEYPGYGARDGSPSEPAFLAAALEAIAAIPGNPKPVIVGESLGTAVACQVARAVPERISGILLVTPFDSLAGVGKVHYPYLPARLLMADRFDSVAALSTYDGPSVIFLAGDDTITPPELGRRLHAAHRGPKRIREFPGAGHNDLPFAAPAAEWRAALDFALGVPR